MQPNRNHSAAPTHRSGGRTEAILAYTGIPLLSGLHGVNALIMIGLGGYLTGRNCAFRRETAVRATTR